MSGARLCSALLIAVAGLVLGVAAADAQMPPIVLRGSAAADGFSGASSPPVILRGTTSPAAAATTPAPGAPETCPAGYVPDPNAGCVAAGFTSAPYDDDWLYGYPLIEGGQRFRRRFAERRARQFRPTRAAARPTIRFAHPGSFGRR